MKAYKNIAAFILVSSISFLFVTNTNDSIEEQYIEKEKPLGYNNGFPINDNVSIRGYASYYDYVLKSGWSSIGHRVCATRDYPRGSCVIATNVANKKTTMCKVTDYGPDASVHPDRIIDLSSTAFSDIARTSAGIVFVETRLCDDN